MKKILFLLFSISILAVSCAKDEDPVNPIDKFIGNVVGNMKEYSCSDSPVILSTLENVKAEITKEDDTHLNGTLKDSDGNKIISFSGILDGSDDTKFNISNFVYNIDTLFGEGNVTNSKLTISLATTACPKGNNTYQVTREFKQQ